MFSKIKKGLSLLLASAMIVTLVPTTALADYEDQTGAITMGRKAEATELVAVYASDGTDTSLAGNSDVLRLLNIQYVQDDDFAPIGVISLPKSFFSGKNSSHLINSEADWAAVRDAITDIDTSKLQNQGSVNSGNTVKSNLDKVSVDLGKGMGSQYTALFKWSGSEHADSRYGKTAICGKYGYHLDLRFETRTITYTGVYTDSKGTHEVALGSRVFLCNTPTIEPSAAGDWYLNTSVIPNGYILDGYYSDKALSSGFAFGSALSSNVTVYVKLTKSDLSVKYDLNGGSSSTTKLEYKNLKLGSEMPKISNPTKTGYTFAGWDAVDAEGNVVASYGPDALPNYVTSSATYVAKWTPSKVTYTVVTKTEKLDGSFSTSTATYDGITGETATYTGTTPEGFTLDESKSTTSATIEADSSTELVVLYTRNSYEVSYKYTNANLPKHYTELPATKSYKFGETVVVASAASAKGYSFSGWSKNSTFEMPASNVEITGVFTANGSTEYKVEHYTKNLNDSGYTLYTTKTFTGDADTTAYANAIDITGFTYDAANSANVLSGTIDVDSTLVLKVYYSRNKYTVSYSYTGEVPKDATKLEEAGLKTEYYYGEKVSAKDAEAEGYTFSGWSKNDFVIGESDSTNIEITGSFTANKNTVYKITYYLENLENDDFALAEAKTVTKTGTTGDQTSVVAGELEGFNFDADNENNVLSGTIAGDGSLELKLYYTRKTYKVTYQYGGSETGAELPVGGEYKYGTQITVAGKTDVDGYTFSNWTVVDSNDNEYSSTKFEMPAADVVISGSYTPNEGTEYTVNYYTENIPSSANEEVGYTLVETVKLNATTDDEVEADTTKTIKGYFLDETVEGSSLSGKVKGDGSLVLNAYYSRKTYTVSYAYDTVKTDVDSVTLPEQKSYKYGDVATVATNLSLAGYSFTWDKTGSFTVDSDITIYGAFKANTDTKYVVYHMLEKVDGTGYDLDSSITGTNNLTGTTDTSVTAKANQYEGFTYNETKSKEFSTGTIAGDGSLELYLYYDRNEYQVTYALVGEVPSEMKDAAPAAKTYKYGAQVKLADKLSTEGYDFIGWSKAEDFTMPASNVTIEGSFVERGDTKYTVKYYFQGLDGVYTENSDELQELQGTTNASVYAIANEYTGFTYNNSLSTASGVIEAKGTTVLSLYYDRNLYEVSYSYDGFVPEGASKAPATEELFYGAELKLADEATAPAGYTFQGWGTISTTTMPAMNLEFVGRFVANNDTKYTVEHYKQNVDGSYSQTPSEVENLTGTTDTVAKAVIKTSYSQFDYVKNDNEILSGNINGDGSLVLKVYYERKTYTLAYKYAGYVPVSASELPEKNTYRYGETVKVASNSTAKGFTFSGWGTEEETITISGNTTLFGSFVADGTTPYTINHYLEQLDGSFELADTELKTGAANTSVTPNPHVYKGYTVTAVLPMATINEDGETVIDLYYYRNVYKVVVEYKDVNGNTLAPTVKKSVTYGGSFIIYSPDVTGYASRFTAVTSPKGGMPDHDITVVVIYDYAPIGGGDDETEDVTPTTPVAPVNPIAPGTVVDTEDALETEQIQDDSIPMGQITLNEDGDAEIVSIEDADTALYADKKGWALVNLICMVIGAVYAIYLAILMFRRRKKNKDEEDSEPEDEETKKDKKMFKLLSILAGIISVIVFIITENIKNPMIIVDNWTIVMIILLVVEFLFAFFSRRKTQKDEEDK